MTKNNNKQALKIKAQELSGLAPAVITLTNNGNKAIFNTEYLVAIIRWYDKLAEHIEFFTQLDNQVALLSFTDDYFSIGDEAFELKYNLPRDEAPFVLISTLITTEHYALKLTDGQLTISLSETPYSLSEKYIEFRHELFNTVTPDAITLQLDHDKADDSGIISLSLESDDIASNFCSILDKSKKLTLPELKQIEPQLKSLADAELFRIDDISLICDVIKTALHYNLYSIHEIKYDSTSNIDVFNVCTSCLKNFGLKRLSENSCH